ncbi:hypothetical protein KGQ31_02240 [Patescibacteria group bacterium]|nr:hypothetical protein [Patescibacteria group bacterium]
MQTETLYRELPGKVAVADARFRHVMALALNPADNYESGVIRCVVSRVGDVGKKGFQDRSELHFARKDQSGGFDIGERLLIANEEKVIASLADSGHDFIGLEDPDIWIDEQAGLLNLYFTIPLIGKIDKNNKKIAETLIHLGHAVGKDLNSLEMTDPTLAHVGDEGAKEVSIAPINKKGFRYNLVESSSRDGKTSYSVIKTAIAEDMGKPWIFGKTVFHPAEWKIPWIAGHASPGPVLPRSFIDLGGSKLLGIINGREANKIIGGETVYGIFSVGLFIYDYEQGKIDWVIPEPFIRDSEARTITFASQFVPLGAGRGILYAHVDDSFVRAYELNADDLRPLLP